MKLEKIVSTTFLIALLTVVLFVGVWQIKPAQATTYFVDGLESGSFSEWNGTNVGGLGSPSITVQSSVKNSGTYAAQADVHYTSAFAQCYRHFATTYSLLYARGYYRVSALPSSGKILELLAITDNGYAHCLATARIYTSGSSHYWSLAYGTNTVSETDVNSAADTINVGQWYCIEIMFLSASGTGEVQMWVNGTSMLHITSLTNNNLVASDIYTGAYVEETDDFTVYIDDVAVSDAYIGLVSGSSLPTFGTVSANVTLAGNATQISCTISADSGMSSWGFAWNNTGSTVNATKIVVSGASVTALYNGTWNATVGNNVWVQFWANDTSNNVAYSGVKTFTLISSSGLTEGDGVPSDWNYRVSKNTTSIYLIDYAGAILDDDNDFGVIVNLALESASGDGGGSIYVYPDSYTTTTQMGYIGWYGTGYTNVYLQFGDETTVTRTGGGGDSLFQLHSYNGAGGTTNFTLISNGTATFDGGNYCSGFAFYGILNLTVANVTIQHLTGDGFDMGRIRYGNFENITVHSPHQTVASGFVMGLGDIQYSTFKNMELDGNDNGLSEGFYLGDWDGNTFWHGSFFNTISQVWVHNIHRNGFYLNGGGEAAVYNNTFTNCTAENNAQGGYFGIKLRPAYNNTFTDIIIRNMTGGVTTGTGMLGEENGNCTGNYVQAALYGMTVESFCLTTDREDAVEVSDNFFNLTVFNSKGTYFANWDTSPIKNNIIYMNITDGSGLYIEGGNITQNTFYLNFSRCGGEGYSDIRHYSGWSSVINNTFNVYMTSGNPNGLMDFVNGTQGNIVMYPYVAGNVGVVIASPTNTTYTSSTVSVELYASGGTIDEIWWNCKNGSSWIFGSNQTYTVPTSMTGFVIGTSYTFYAWANNTDGDWDEETVMFTVEILASTVEWGGYWGSWWGYP